MASNLAPGIEILNQSFSQRIEATGEIVFGTIGVFTKGPVNERILVTSVKQLIDVFGEPSDFSASYFLPIAKIIEDGRAPVHVVRVEDSEVSCSAVTVGLSGSDMTASAMSTPIEVDAYPLSYDSVFSSEQVSISGYSDTLTFAAVGPGETYDSVAVSVINYDDYNKMLDFRASLADAITPTDVQSIAETAYTMAVSGQGMTMAIAEELIDPDTSYQVDTQLLDEYIAFENGPSSSDEFGVYEYFGGAFQQAYLVSTDSTKKDRFAQRMFMNRVLEEGSENLEVL